MYFKLVSFCFLFSFFTSFAQKNYISEIDSLIKAKEPRDFNGVVLITKNRKTIYSKAQGFVNVNTKVPLQLDNQFEIMSNTKQITAVLLLKEVEKGKVDLQSPIKKYIPHLTQPWANSVTVHQLLNHTHGITDLEKPLLFEPGTDFKYGNLSNILLGKIIENVSGTSYIQLANTLFQQLGMKNTSCYSTDNRKKRVTGHVTNNHVYTPVEKTLITNENMSADGVITTAKDLSIWNDQLHKGKVLKPATYKQMTSPSALSQHDIFGKEKKGYGYNIRIINDQNTHYLGHTGLGDGFTSLNVYIPKSDISIIVLENQMNENSDLYYYFETAIKNIILKSDLVNQ